MDAFCIFEKDFRTCTGLGGSSPIPAPPALLPMADPAKVMISLLWSFSVDDLRMSESSTGCCGAGGNGASGGGGSVEPLSSTIDAIADSYPSMLWRKKCWATFGQSPDYIPLFLKHNSQNFPTVSGRKIGRNSNTEHFAFAHFNPLFFSSP